MTLVSSAPPAPRVRHIVEADLTWALAEGWSDFKAKRGDLIVLALIYPIVGLLAASAAFDERILPLFFPLVAGMSILGPAVASGFYELARRREAGLDSNWLHFVDPLKGRSRFPLAVLTGVLAVLFVAWVFAAALIYLATVAAETPVGVSGFVHALFATPRGWALIIVGNLVGFVFAAVTVTLSLVSFPLVVDKSLGAGAALATSIRAVRANPALAASWGLRVAALLVLGSIPLFIGLAIVLPVLGYATWHLYTRLIER
jgi:uncharacterized membrane protein